MSLLISLRSELLKTKWTAPFYFTIAAAAFGPFMTMLELVLDGFEDNDKHNIFNHMFSSEFIITNLIALPFFLILVCTLLSQIEFKNNTWKQIFTSPQHKFNVYAAKFINVQILIAVFFITNLLLMFLSAVILHLMEPSINVLQQPLNWNDLLMARVNAYTALLAMCAIQFWLGLKFKNFIIPVAIGIACWFAGSILVMQKMDFAAYFPYSFHAYGHFPKHNPQNNASVLMSLIYTVIFFIIGFCDFKRRKST